MVVAAALPLVPAAQEAALAWDRMALMEAELAWDKTAVSLSDLPEAVLASELHSEMRVIPQEVKTSVFDLLLPNH